MSTAQQVLLDEAPPPPVEEDLDGDGDDGAQWVTVATFWQPAEAQIARLRLESNDVECLILDENVVATDWLYANAVGGIKLRVRESDARTARELLDRPRDSTSEQPVITTPGECRECGSGDTHRPIVQRKTIWAACVAVFLSGYVVIAPLVLGFLVAYVILVRPWKCRTCGNTWRPSGEQKGFEVVTKSQDV